MHRINRREGGGIRGVGHHTDNEVAVIGGAVLACPEGNLHCGEVQRGIHGRHNGVAVAAGACIEVQAVGVVVAV